MVEESKSSKGKEEETPKTHPPTRSPPPTCIPHTQHTTAYPPPPPPPPPPPAPTKNEEEEETNPMKIADAALSSSQAASSSWQPMLTTTTTTTTSSSTVPAWWAKVGSQTTQFLDTAAAIFAERRRLILSVAGTFLFLVVAFTLSSPAAQQVGTSSGSGGRGGGGSSTGGGDLPTNLRRLVQATRLKALRKGKLGLGGTSAVTPALQPLATTHEIVRDHHVDFILSTVKPEALRHKHAAQSFSPSSSPSRDPFGEGQREALLTVSEVGPGHVLMLNKFPTFTDHLILVTKEWQPQEGLLRAEDLYAWWCLIKDTPAIGIFNSGPESGASQAHRHLQAIPLDVFRSLNPDYLLSTTHPIPFDALVEEFRPSAPTTVSFRLPSLPFRHRMFLLNDDLTAHELEGLYHRLLKRIGFDVHGAQVGDGGAGGGVVEIGGGGHKSQPQGRGTPVLQGLRSRPPPPSGDEVGGNGHGGIVMPSPSAPPSTAAYNLVLTERWLLAVPRSQHSYLGVDVNGIGFFGALLTNDHETADVVKRVGPFNILKGVVPP